MNLPNLDIVQTFISRRLVDTLKRSLHSKTPLFQMSCKNRRKKPNTLWSEKNENLILICVKDLRYSLQYRNHCSGSWHCSTCLEDDMLSHEQANEATFSKCKRWKLSSIWPKVSREPKPPAALSCTSHSWGASLGAVYLPDHPLHPCWGPRDSHFHKSCGGQKGWVVVLYYFSHYHLGRGEHRAGGATPASSPIWRFPWMR